jgi:hypothetical protein
VPSFLFVLVHEIPWGGVDLNLDNNDDKDGYDDDEEYKITTIMMMMMIKKILAIKILDNIVLKCELTRFLASILLYVLLLDSFGACIFYKSIPVYTLLLESFGACIFYKSIPIYALLLKSCTSSVKQALFNVLSRRCLWRHFRVTIEQFLSVEISC